MNYLKTHYIYAAVVSTIFGINLSVASHAFAQNLLTNGNFEAGNVDFSTGYAQGPLNSDGGLYNLTTDPNNNNAGAASYGDHTTGSGLMLAFNGATSSDVIAWSETVAVLSNSDYTFSGWVSNWTADPVAELDMSVNGASIGTMNAPETAGVWQPFTFNWASGSATSADLTIIDNELDAYGNDFALDDLSFSAVPEPASLALVGAMCLLQLRRRREA